MLRGEQDYFISAGGMQDYSISAGGEQDYSISAGRRAGLFYQYSEESRTILSVQVGEQDYFISAERRTEHPCCR